MKQCLLAWCLGQTKTKKNIEWAQWSYPSLFSCMKFLRCGCWQQIFAFSRHERKISGKRIGLCSVMWCIKVINTCNTWMHLITHPHAVMYLITTTPWMLVLSIPGKKTLSVKSRGRFMRACNWGNFQISLWNCIKQPPADHRFSNCVSLLPSEVSWTKTDKMILPSLNSIKNYSNVQDLWK